MTFVEMDLVDQMYPFPPDASPGVQRADVFAISWVNPVQVRLYECKVSWADFKSDLRSKKYQGYSGHCNLFYFVTPYGLISKEEVPDGYGWLQQNKQDKRFRIRLTGDLNRGYTPSPAQLLACIKKKEKSGWAYH